MRLRVQAALDGLERDNAVGQSEQGVVLPWPTFRPGERRYPLTDQDRTCSHVFAAVGLDAKALELESRPFRVEPVPFLPEKCRGRMVERGAGGARPMALPPP